MADGSGEGRDALSGRHGPDGTGSGVAEQGLAVAEHHGESTHGKEENVDSLDLARSGASARAESDPMVRSRPIHEEPGCGMLHAEVGPKRLVFAVHGHR